MLYPEYDSLERRDEGRYPFPHMIHLTPVGRDGLTPCGQNIVVVGKTLSKDGLGFFHSQPLPNRRMIASVALSDGRWLGFLIDLRWCRFRKHGWYESGGRFLQAVASPIDRPKPAVTSPADGAVTLGKSSAASVANSVPKCSDESVSQ